MSNNGSSASEASSIVEETWTAWFCNLAGNSFYCEVDKTYIEDSFNLFGLKQYLPHKDYSKALHTILDRTAPSDLEGEESSRSAAFLYGLIHARYIMTSHGLEAMRRKFMLKDFGDCPRTYCRGQAVLPIGLSDEPRHSTVKIFCPKCKDVYAAPHFRHIDGAAFGPTFPHLFLMTYEDDDIVQGTREPYVPRIFGFKIHANGGRAFNVGQSLPRHVDFLGGSLTEADQRATGTQDQQAARIDTDKRENADHHQQELQEGQTEPSQLLSPRQKQYHAVSQQVQPHRYQQPHLSQPQQRRNEPILSRLPTNQTNPNESHYSSSSSAMWPIPRNSSKESSLSHVTNVPDTSQGNNFSPHLSSAAQGSISQPLPRVGSREKMSFSREGLASSSPRLTGVPPEMVYPTSAAITAAALANIGGQRVYNYFVVNGSSGLAASSSSSPASATGVLGMQRHLAPQPPSSSSADAMTHKPMLPHSAQASYSGQYYTQSNAVGSNSSMAGPSSSGMGGGGAESGSLANDMRYPWTEAQTRSVSAFARFAAEIAATGGSGAGGGIGGNSGQSQGTGLMSTTVMMQMQRANGNHSQLQSGQGLYNQIHRYHTVPLQYYQQQQQSKSMPHQPQQYLAEERTELLADDAMYNQQTIATVGEYCVDTGQSQAEYVLLASGQEPEQQLPASAFASPSLPVLDRSSVGSDLVGTSSVATVSKSGDSSKGSSPNSLGLVDVAGVLGVPNDGVLVLGDEVSVSGVASMVLPSSSRTDHSVAAPPPLVDISIESGINSRGIKASRRLADIASSASVLKEPTRKRTRF